MELAIPLISPAVQIIGDNLKINSVTGGSTTSRKREFIANRHQQHYRKETKNLCNNKFKVATTPDTATLEYYQSIYTHIKQRFNIPDGIKVVKKSVYQYIENCINNYFFGNYNISKVRSNLYNNLVHYSQLGTEDLNSETLATYFQELNFNIIEYCKEKYPVQSKYSFDFESETETSNKSKQKLKQYSKTTLNTPILPKTIAKHLQTPEQGTSSKLPLTITPFSASLAQAETPNLPLNQFSRLKNYTSPRSPTRQQETLQTSTNFLDYLAENTSKHSETLANEENVFESIEEEVEPEEKSELIDNEEENKMTAYIVKIPKFNGEDIETSPQEWLNQVNKAGDANRWNANNSLITTPRNIKQEPSESVITYIGKFNKLLRQICQLKTNDYYSNAQILDQFIVGLKDKLIKKVCLHALEDLATAIQQVKNYKMAMEEANCTKLLNTTSPTNSNNSSHSNHNKHKDTNFHKDEIKIIFHHFLITSLRIAIIVEFLATGKEIAESYNETNKIGVINQSYYQPPLPAYYLPRPQYQTNPTAILTTTHTILSSTCLKIDSTKSIHITKLIPTQPRSNYYHIQTSYLTMPEEQDFHYTVLLEARIAENANLLDIFPFEFKANESSFLLSNATANEQKVITVIYTETKIEGKPIHLILNNGFAKSIITYQLIQQLKRNVDRPAQTIIVTVYGMKKTPVGEIDNFLFTIDRITIPVKVLVIDAPQYQALVGNNWLQKANANLNWETQELTISYQEQHAQVPATCSTFNKCSEKAPAFEFEPEEEKPIIETFMALGSTSNWADKTEQQYFSTYDSLKTKEPVTSGWNKLSSIEACILPKEEYENHTCYYCKACYRERWDHLIKRSRKWDNTPCLICGNMLPEEYNWINVAMRGGVCDQTCQYVLSISEKVKRGTPFDAVYNSILNKLYYYPHDAKMIFDLAMALINKATQENVRQMKESEYIAYTFKITGYNYEDKVEVYYQIASYIYPTKKAQAQWLEQMNIKLCEKCIMPCNEQWCPECYALSIPLLSESNEYEIEFREPEATEEIETTPIYLIENQPASQLKYFNNNGQEIKSKKVHKIDIGYNLRYPGKDTLTLKPKLLTKINLKIVLKIPPGAIVQITS
ncbi:hypothetical protein G9A89_007904 [Geosiphon pyriformis]|nr:hypothetical protein G9A89_007904 [Geosiphon pyriformis]